MYVVRILLACALAVGLTLAAGAEQKGKPKDKDKDKSGSIDKGKLVGTWMVAEDGLLGDKGGTYEFTKDGKLNVKNKKGKGGSGTYKIDGDTVTMTYSLAGQSATTPPLKVTKLTDKELVLDGPAGGTETKLTRK